MHVVKTAAGHHLTDASGRTFGREDEDLAQGEAGLDADHLDKDKASLDRVGTGQVLLRPVVQGAREPGTQPIAGHAGRVSYSDLEIMEGRVATASAGQDPDDLDVVRLQQVHHPPGRRLALGLGAELVLVQDADVTVVGVPRVPSSDRRGLVRRLAVRHVHRCT